MVKRQRMLALLTGLACCMTAGLASAAIDKVICVPWQGDVNKQHTIISGQAAQLKCVIKTTDTSAVYSKWAFGDGSADSALVTHSGATKYNVATTHAYTAAVGTPFTAKLQVSNATPFALAKEDPYLVKVEADNINAQINVAIDTGLWWLHTQGNALGGYASYPQTYDGSPSVAWLQTSHIFSLAAPTASAVHAFGINGHKIKGNPDQDPYVETVKGGLNYLLQGYNYYTTYPILTAVDISTPPRAGDIADVNGNGLGISVYDWGNSRPIYQSGQVMDAIIASGVLPTDLTGRDFAPGTAKSHNWTYKELLQDMADMHAWGQSDDSCNSGTCGSWWYGWNYTSGDNSASQWPAIGMLPAQEAPWNVVVPGWVKTYNANWLEYSKCFYDGAGGIYNYFGYNGPCSCAGDSCMQTTTSGMVQMIFANQPTTDAKWIRAQKYLADSWRYFTHSGSSWGGYMTYGWYSFAKAMRLAKPAPVTQLVKSGGATFDWYYGDPAMTACTGEADCEKGMAQRIIEIQTKTDVNTGAWESGNLSNAPLTTAWMIITLRPTLFAAAPIACFTAAPNPSFADMAVTFDPLCSGHSESGKTIANLKKFEWDWNNDGNYDVSTTTPAPQAHAFACASLPCSYPVRLRVTDDNNPPLTATAEVRIDITNPPHPPVADAGGPYMVSSCAADSLLLNGAASFDQDAGLHQAGCSTCPNDAITAYAWDLAAPLTFDAINKTGVTATLTGAEAVSLITVGRHDIALRVTDNTALAYPGSGQPNLTNVDFSYADVLNGCMCNLTARAKSGKIQLTWTPVAGAATYDIYRSTTNASSGFARIASNVATTYATYLDGAVVNGTQYYYRVIASTGCGSLAAGAMATNR